jgi:hypothetical protein
MQRLTFGTGFTLRPLCTRVRAPGSHWIPRFIGPEAGLEAIRLVQGIEHRRFSRPVAVGETNRLVW